MSTEEQLMTDSALGYGLQWSLLPTPRGPEIASGDHLQSLGLDVKDGLPKFKLNEPGPAALASSIFQQNNMVNDESEQSFVVLGQTSLESIREASLANYMEIQQKSSFTDHSSLISVMSPIEIEENLKQVLEENIKLRETLKQNNTTIKQQFNTITKWQKEVMAVCDTHKQKFMETKDMINKLKKENDELREKIANQSAETSLSNDATTISNSIDNVIVSAHSLLKKSNYLSTESTFSKSSIFTNPSFKEEKKVQNDQTPMEDELLLVKKIDTLSKELSTVKFNHSKTQEVLQELEKRYATDIELFSQQLQKSNKELEDFKQKSDSSNASELQKLVSKCCEKDNELTYLKEIITSLENQIKKLEENAYSTTNLQLEILEGTSKDKDQLKENVEFYNQKVRELNKCFASQCSRYIQIQEFLKESSDIIHVFENADVLANSTIPMDKLKYYKDKLCDYRKRLIDEQLQSIDDKLTTIKVQKQFQKILSDYNAVVYELEILRDENSKLMTLQTKAAEENSQKLAEIEKYLDDEKKILDGEKTNLLEERLNVQIEKKLIAEEKEKLEVERNSLSLEKERLAEERTSLIEERTSLDRQSKLYEAREGTLHKEKKYLQNKCDNLNDEIVRLKQELNLAGVTIQQLRADNLKLKENEEIISVYKIQTELHQKEFEEMRVCQQNLQDQLQSLSMANLQLRTDNDRLGGQESQQEIRDEACSSDYSNLIFCPKCKNGIPVNRVADHFAQCYDPQ